MSSNIRAIREIPGDPIAKFANELAKKLSRFLTKDQLDLLEDREDIYLDGQDLDVAVKIHDDDLLATKTFNFTTQYFPPFEPDGDKLKIWIRGINLGNTIKDWTGFTRTTTLAGDPLLIDGTPFDDGTKTAGVKSTCLRFNRPTSQFVNQEYIEIADTEGIQMAVPTGISYFIRFRVHDLAAQNGYTRTLYMQENDNDNKVMIQVTSDGRITFNTVRSATERNNRTPAGTITTNTVYDVWCTYAYSGNVFHIYVNNVDQTLTDPGTASWPTNTDAQIFRRSESTGYVYGDLYDFRYYKEKVVSSTEVGYHYTNKWTIVNIPFGAVIIANYWATYNEAGMESFTSTSFTTTSFT